MLLTDKVAVIYGAGGAVGGAVARAFAREGAKVFLTGRNLASVEVVPREGRFRRRIRRGGGARCSR
jgi:NADP-dependent 3-hydroxy acid dehydrogenase YdfG